MPNDFNRAPSLRKACSALEVCNKYDCTSDKCEPDKSLAQQTVKRCTHAEKAIITILASIDEKLSILLEK